MSSQPTGGPVGPSPSAWGVVVPVKPLRTAKSRLAELGEDVRRDLVLAFLHDTVSAVLEARSVRLVVVVTDDVVLARAATDLGARAVPDGHTDLNATLVQGAAEVLRRSPDVGLVAGCADLPALRGADLDDWLSVRCAGHRAFVGDVAGHGTTVVRAADLAGFTPAFGLRSREAHARLGFVDLTDRAAPGLRQDVDTAADLEAAAELGLGERTRWVLTAHRL